MRCEQCDYALWAARGGKCPECGAAFHPADYTFLPHSVRFACPHCDQDYYSSEPDGHLEASAFDCTRCCEPLHISGMILTPVAGFESTAATLDNLPWRHWRRVGLLRAWLQTLWLSMFSPGRMMRSVPPADQTAMRFAVLTIAVGVIVASVFIVSTSYAASASRLSAMLVPKASTLVLTLVFSFFGVYATAFAILIWAYLTHMALALTGRLAHGMDRTLQALCYSAGPIIFVAAAGITGYAVVAGLLWWWVGSIVAAREAQQVSVGRAAVAVSAAPMSVLAVLILLMTYGPPPRVGPMPRPAPAPVTTPGVPPFSTP